MRYTTRALALVVLAALGACSIDGVTFTGGNSDASPDSPKDAPMPDAPLGPLGIIVSTGKTVMVTEGDTMSAMITLSQPPPGPVLITLESSDDTRIGISPSAVLFSTADWNMPQTVTLSGKQDLDAIDETGKITLRSTAVATPFVVDVTVDDDDGLTLALSATSLDVGEGSTGTLSAHLTAQPQSTVMVTVMSTNTAAATTSQSTLVFTTANWAIDQTITITGLQDADTINNMLAIDFTAPQLMATSLPIQVTDDDILGIATSTSSLAATEGGNQTFSVQLTLQPTSTTTVTVMSGNPAVATVAPTMLTFTTANWNLPQSVTVTAVQDDDVAGGATSLMLMSTGLMTRTVSVSVTDDDVQAIVTAPSTNLAVTEGGTSQLGVSLAFKPPANRTVSVVSLDTTVATINPATLTFTPANYNIPQMITVTGVQDIDAAPDTTIVRLDALSLSIMKDVTVNVADDEVLQIDATPNPVAVTEGSTANLMIRLTAQPAANTTVNIMSNAPATAVTTPTSVAFTTSNWNVFQTVTVNGVEDVDLAAGSAILTLSSTGLPSAQVMVNVADNDMQAVLPGTTPVTVTEGSSTSVGVRLAFMPAADVTVNVASMMPTIATATPATLTFSPANYNTPQPIMITGTQDADAVNNSTMITLGATGATTGTIVVNVTDDDGLNIQINPTTLTIGEAGTGILQVRLTAMPTANTTVMVSSGDLTAATVSPAMLTFTPANYSTYQNVTVTGVDDADAGDETVTVTAMSTGIPSATATVTVTDNETQTIVTSVASVTFSEGTTTTFGVHLGAQPSGNVVVTLGSGNVGVATVSPTMLTFTAANYMTDQMVTITALEEPNAELDVVSISATSPGVAIVHVQANITDNDTQAVVVTPTTVNVTEGSTQNVDVTLAYQPTTNVTVTIMSDDDAIATGAPATLTFTASNYTTPQQVSIKGTDDDDIVDDNATISFTAPGATQADVTVNVMDNDTLDIELSPVSVSVLENGADTFGVRLTAQPTGSVVVNVDSSDMNKATVTPATLTFDAINWNVYQNVTVFGADDPDSNDESATVTLTSPGVTTQTASVTVVDDDTTGIVAPASVTVVENSSNQFFVSLSSSTVIVGTITVDVTSLDPTKVMVFPTQLTFDSSNFNQPQPVNVFAPDDADLLDDFVNITLTSPGIPTEVVTVEIRDDDAQQILISETDLEVREGNTPTVFVQLAYDPGGTVFVTVASDNPMVPVTPMILTFDSSNYQTGQPVQIMTFADADFDETTARITYTGPAPGVSTRVTVIEPDILKAPVFMTTTVCQGKAVTLDIGLQGVPVRPLTFNISVPPTLLSSDSQVTLDSSNLGETIGILGQSPTTGARVTVIPPSGYAFKQSNLLRVLSSTSPGCQFP